MRAYIDNINALLVISECQLKEIHKFWQTLNYNVQSLETLGKLSGCLPKVHGVLDRLPGIKADLVNGKPGWKDWGFEELMQSLEEWKAIYTMKVNESVHHCLHPSILALHIRRVLLVFPAKVVSTRKIADQSHDTRVFTAIV